MLNRKEIMPSKQYICMSTCAELLTLSYLETRIDIMNREIDAKLKFRNIRPTAMRQLVLKILIEQKTAISLSELENKFEKGDKTTLYRTLKTFQENQLIHSIEDGSGSIRYALCEDFCSCEPKDLHIHFLCNKCGKTYCLKKSPVPRPDLPDGFEFSNASFVIKGICSTCKT